MKRKLTTGSLAAVCCIALLGCSPSMEKTITVSTNLNPVLLQTEKDAVEAAQARLKHPTDMPPGYTLLCDGQGNYGLKEPDGFVSSISERRKQDIVSLAWLFYDADSRPRPPRKTNWMECSP